MRDYIVCIQPCKLFCEQDCMKYSGSTNATCVLNIALLSASTLYRNSIKIIPVTAEAMTSAYPAIVEHRATQNVVIKPRQDVENPTSSSAHCMP